MKRVNTMYGWALSFCAVALGAGCAPAPDESSEEVGQATQAVESPTCLTIRRGATGDVADAFLSGDHPTWATGTDWGMWSGVSSGGNLNRALLRPDLSSIPEGSTVVSAHLNMRMSWSPANNQIGVHRVIAPWSEATVSLATFDPAGIEGSPAATFAGGLGGTRSIDVTGLVADWVSGAAPNHGVALMEAPVERHYFYTSEVSTETSRPSFEVCYLPPEPEPLFDATGCGPNVLFTDPAKFATIPGTDFEDDTFKPYFQNPNASAATPWLHEGIHYHPWLAIQNNWCIPGMDTGVCSGTNWYMTFDGTRHVDPVVDTTAIGFRWGTQGSSVTIQVHLTDGTTRSFVRSTPAPGGWGAAGFFGYCTGSDALKVQKVTISGPDGGIDDVRCLGCQ